MNKIIKFLTFVLVLCFISSPVFSYNSRDEEIKQLKEQLLYLQKRLEKLEKEQQAQKQENKQIKGFVGKIYKKTGGIIEKLDKIKLSLGANLASTYYNVQKDVDKGVTTTDDTFVNLMDLKFSAQPTDEIQFHATLTMYKLWGVWNDPYSTVGSSDYDVTANPSDSSVRVKRVYVDYRPKFLKEFVNLEFGRLPTSGGYLTKYRYNIPSRTTYPDLAFNGNSDGVALTFYLNKFLPYAKTLTFVYTKSKYDRDQYPFISDNIKLSDVNFYTVQLDTAVPFLKRSNLTMLWIRTDQLRVPFSTSQMETLEKALQAQLSNFGLTLDKVNYPEYLGYYDKLVFQFDVERILDSPLDLFASFAYSWTNPNGDTITYTAKGLPTVFKLPSYYIVSSDNKDKKEGRAIYLGLRYNIDSDMLNNPKVGVEYNYGSRHWIGMNVAELDPFKKLNIRGQVWEVYWIQPFVENKIQMRTGFQYIDREYTDSLFGGVYGQAADIDEIDKVFYLSLDFYL